jgi:hypothetical protein
MGVPPPDPRPALDARAFGGARAAAVVVAAPPRDGARLPGGLGAAHPAAPRGRLAARRRLRRGDRRAAGVRVARGGRLRAALARRKASGGDRSVLHRIPPVRRRAFACSCARPRGGGGVGAHRELGSRRLRDGAKARARDADRGDQAAVLESARPLLAEAARGARGGAGGGRGRDLGGARRARRGRGGGADGRSGPREGVGGGDLSLPRDGGEA